MKKTILLYFVFLLISLPAKAQPALWESLPLELNGVPWVMYYDSISDASYVGGNFTMVGDSICNVVKLDQNGYTLLPNCPLGNIYDMIRYDGKIYASGGGGMASWDGNAWLLSDSINDVGSTILYQDKLWACLELHTDTGDIRTVGLWNDTAATWANVCHADTLLGSWTVRDLVFYKDELYIAGNINPTNHPEINEIARFDGSHWRDVGGFEGGSLAAIWDVLVWKDTLYACGEFSEAGGAPGNSIAKWDGQQWHRLGEGLLQAEPAATDMIIFNNELYVTGWFYMVGGINPGYDPLLSKGFAKWDGNRWCTMGTGADNVMFTMGRFRDSLYVMGAFDSLNNEPMQHIAKWIGGDYTDSCTSGALGIKERNHSSGPMVLRLYPNPASAWLIVQFDTDRPSALTISIEDILGRTRIHRDYGKAGGGSSRLQLDVSGLSPGIYHLELHDGVNSYSKKLLIQR